LKDDKIKYLMISQASKTTDEISIYELQDF